MTVGLEPNRIFHQGRVHAAAHGRAGVIETVAAKARRPWRGVEAPSGRPGAVAWVRSVQYKLDRVLEVINASIHALLLGTGERPGELCGFMPRQAAGLWLLRWRTQTWQVWLVTFVLVVSSLCSEAWDVERTLAVAAKMGPRALDGARALQSLQAELQVVDEPSKLRGVNEFFNRRVLFRDDIDIWGQADYWASPLEMLDKGSGDCEDYAIAKYFSLLGLGVPVAKLRMVYVRAQLGGVGGPSQAHMVLAYYESANAEPLILDNLVSEVRPSSRRPDLSPVFSFNSEGLWQGVSAQAASGDPVARLSRWRDVLAKARAEGFQ